MLVVQLQPRQRSVRHGHGGSGGGGAGSTCLPLPPPGLVGIIEPKARTCADANGLCQCMQLALQLLRCVRQRQLCNDEVDCMYREEVPELLGCVGQQGLFGHQLGPIGVQVAGAQLLGIAGTWT